MRTPEELVSELLDLVHSLIFTVQSYAETDTDTEDMLKEAQPLLDEAQAFIDSLPKAPSLSTANTCKCWLIERLARPGLGHQAR